MYRKYKIWQKGVYRMKNLSKLQKPVILKRTLISLILISLLAITLDIDGHTQDSINRFTAWKNGDLSELEKFSGNYRDMPPELFAEFANITWINRDIKIIEAAQQYMAEGKKVFLVTGFLHMHSESGIINTLRERGYTVEQVIW